MLPPTSIPICTAKPNGMFVIEYIKPNLDRLEIIAQLQKTSIANEAAPIY